MLDFIGNYQKNFFVPVALSGDKTYNKDRLRTIVNDGSSVIPGASTVSFDRISEARIYRAIDGGRLHGGEVSEGGIPKPASDDRERSPASWISIATVPLTRS